MDADFSHSPEYLPAFLEKIEKYDVVVGSRYVPGGKLDERWSFGRYLLSWWANSVYVRLILGLKVRDATAGFKLWRRSALEKIDLEQGARERLYFSGGNGVSVGTKWACAFWNTRFISRTAASGSPKWTCASNGKRLRVSGKFARATVPSQQPRWSPINSKFRKNTDEHRVASSGCANRVAA